MVNKNVKSTRAFIRFPCELAAEITFSGGEKNHVKKALISNISTAGIQILSPSFIATGQKITATFKVPGHSSKTTFTAEIMRIESLQSRMIGHYPYALGAKFVSPKANQEKQITRFILRKITCASARGFATLLLFPLAIIQLARTLVYAHYLNAGNSVSSLYGMTQLPFISWITHPLAAILIAAGLWSSIIFTLINRKNFQVQGIMWTGVSIFLSIIRIFVKKDLLFGTFDERFIGWGEIIVLGVETALIVIFFRLIFQLKKAAQLLTAEKISAGFKRPTFTIL